MEKVITTQQFWDCGCDKDYIQWKGAGVCPKCYNTEQDMPDSHVDEVPTYLLEAAKVHLKDELAIIENELCKRLQTDK